MVNPSTLGSLEKQIMNAVWNENCETGRQVWEQIKKNNDIAYTTVMTVMNRLVTKGLLTKSQINGKTYTYKSSGTKQQNVRSLVKNTLEMWVNMFGEEAVATFIDEADRIAHQKKKKS